MNRSNQPQSGQSKAGADFLQLDTADAPAGGLSDWLTERLRAAISDGRLPIGSRLPATRVLAAELQISRGVVTEAYQRLTEDGQVAGRGRAGTVVVAVPPLATGRRPTSPSPAPVMSEPGLDIFDTLRAAPARIDLTPGVPDLAAFPRAAWLRAERAVLNDLESSEFGYGDPAGTPRLRRAVATWLARNRGVSAHPDELIIVAGVSQAIGLVAQMLQTHGITEMAIEDPGSLGTRQHLQNWGLSTPPIPVDGSGLRVDVLRSTGARVVMATPAHHFPTGVVLEGERRRELIQWAAEGGLIVEDDYDAEHRYDRPPVPALRAMLADQVIYSGSVSKLLAPSLRIGWMLPPPQYKDELIGMKRLADLGNAALPQLTLAQLMESGDLERQLRFLRRRHRVRRDAMVDAIGNYLPTATIHGAAAGLHLTITFADDTVKDAELAAAALQKGVKTHPLSWHCQLPHAPGLVLGYAARTPTELTEAIATIAAVM
ncbi:GntR family transcriptional regulator/MocR family aminotransferase [Kribbella antiqua]|uniref:GntR family transcriptional regulator/MocR family aminotransferase n=1 Tax=Kribbella antiqua TaxID=2512217 RepID=A0A4R2IQI7_9ACTN|nr:PLP-dependent aminotransferase family protein [Kribbella antiqua]TCO47553.1 GntR family transcriptional regulator/MocR family aminotransferase [Kribbella antiqua]